MGKQFSVAMPSIAAADRVARHQHPLSAQNGASSRLVSARLTVDDETSTSFAHPAEFDLARILSFYHIRWVYEPTSFHLRNDDEGRPIEQITPDFYLPDYDLYVELTTMRQRLVTRKNRKIRHLKEKHPSVDVKLLYKRDYDRLIGTFPLPDVRDHQYELDRVLLTEHQITSRIEELGGEIAARLAGAGPKGNESGTLLLGLGKGSKVFLDRLRRSIRRQVPSVSTDWITFSSYGTAADERKVRIGRRPIEPIADRHIIVVVDVVSTGLSLAYLTKWLIRKGASSVRVCTLLDRKDARIIEFPIDLSGFNAPIELLAGFGISVGRRFGDGAEISIVKRSPPSQ